MAQSFVSAATGSNTAITPMYTCPASTTAVVHAMYLSNIDGTNDADISVSISGSANFSTRRYLLKTVQHKEKISQSITNWWENRKQQEIEYGFNRQQTTK